MITDPLFDVPIRRGFQFFHADDLDVVGSPEVCTVTRIADGVVYYDKSYGSSSESELTFPDVVGLILAESPPAPEPQPLLTNPTLDEWRLDHPRLSVILDSLDDAVMAESEDTFGTYTGQPLPSNMVDRLSSDEYVRSEIDRLFNDDTIDFTEVRRLRKILGDDLPPVWHATGGLTAAIWNPNFHPRDRKGRFIRVGDIVHWLLGGDEHSGFFSGIEEGKLAVDEPDGEHHLIDANDVLSSERPKAHLRLLPPAEKPDPDSIYRKSLDLREEGKIEEANAVSEAARAASNKWKRDIKMAITYGDISPEDAFERWQWAAKADNGEWETLPDTLYHVTTAKDAVLADRLRSREELSMMSGHGLGGGASDTISLTDDPAVAEAINNAMIEAHHVANGDVTVEDLLAQAERGDKTKRPFLRDIVHYYGQYETYGWREKYQSDEGTWQPGDPYPRGLVAELEEQHTGHFYNGKQTDTPEASRLDFYKVFSFLRQDAGGPMDPLFFTSDASAIASMDPDQIATLKVHPIPGAVGERVQGLAEYRVPTGDVLEIDPIQADELFAALPVPDVVPEPEPVTLALPLDASEPSKLSARDIGRVPVPIDYRPKFSLEGKPTDFFAGEARPYRVRNAQGARIGIVEYEGTLEDGEKVWNYGPDDPAKPSGSGPSRKAAVNDALNKREDLTLENIFPDTVKAADLGTPFFVKRDLSSEMTWDELRQQTVDEAKRTGLYDSIAKRGIILPIQVFVPKKGDPEISTGHHRLAIAQDLGIDVPVRWYGPGYNQMTGRPWSMEPNEYNRIRTSFVPETTEPEMNFGGFEMPDVTPPPPPASEHSTVYDGVSMMSRKDALTALGETLPGLNRTRHIRVMQTHPDGHTEEVDDATPYVAANGLDFLTPRETAAYVQSIQAMKERYDGALDEVIELNVINENIKLQPASGGTALAITQLTTRGSDFAELYNEEEPLSGTAITLSKKVLRDAEDYDGTVMHGATTTSQNMTDPADVVAATMVHEFGHAVHFHQLAQGYSAQTGMTLEETYKHFTSRWSEFDKMLDGTYELDGKHFDPFPIKPLYDEVLTEHLQSNFDREPDESGFLPLLPPFPPTEYARSSPSEFYAEMVTADVQHWDLPHEDEFHALDDLVNQLPGQTALDLAPVAAAGALSEPSIIWTEEFGWVIVDPLGFGEPEPNEEAEPISMLSYAMLPIHSADELEAAVALAEADDSMRWYVERRARALSLEDQLQWSADA